MKNYFRNLIFSVLALTMILGFRVSPGFLKWQINPSVNKLWVNFCNRPSITNNDLPKGDVLYGQSVNFTNLSQSVFDDYNNSTTYFFRLFDEATDGSFSSSNTNNHIINVCFGNLALGEGGNSGQVSTNNQITGCQINLDNSVTSSANNFVHTLTHELGHCMGLEHPMETTYAIMSYFTSATRLQIDDRSGLTFLYPSDPSYANETPTMGLSCAPK